MSDSDKCPSPVSQLGEESHVRAFSASTGGGGVSQKGVCGEVAPPNLLIPLLLISQQKKLKSPLLEIRLLETTETAVLEVEEKVSRSQFVSELKFSNWGTHVWGGITVPVLPQTCLVLHVLFYPSSLPGHVPLYLSRPFSNAASLGMKPLGFPPSGGDFSCLRSRTILSASY